MRAGVETMMTLCFSSFRLSQNQPNNGYPGLLQSPGWPISILFRLTALAQLAHPIRRRILHRSTTRPDTQTSSCETGRPTDSTRLSTTASTTGQVQKPRTSPMGPPPAPKPHAVSLPNRQPSRARSHDRIEVSCKERNNETKGLPKDKPSHATAIYHEKTKQQYEN